VWRHFSPLSLNMELNDVRATGSPPLVWYFQLSLLTVSEEKGSGQMRIPLSLHKTHNPLSVCGMRPHQLCWLGTYPVEQQAGQESLLVYHSRWPTAGRLINAVYHAHQSVHDDSLLFAGALHEATSALNMWPSKDGTKEGPASDDTSAFTFLPTINTVHRTNAAWRKALLATGTPTAAQLRCRAMGAREHVEGSYDEYADRASVPKCLDWTFTAGEAFTTVQFNYPVQANSSRGAGVAVKQHSIWFLTYVANDRHSRYTVDLFQPIDRGAVPRSPSMFDYLVRLWTDSGTKV